MPKPLFFHIFSRSLALYAGFTPIAPEISYFYHVAGHKQVEPDTNKLHLLAECIALALILDYT